MFRLKRGGCLNLSKLLLKNIWNVHFRILRIFDTFNNSGLMFVSKVVQIVVRCLSLCSSSWKFLTSPFHMAVMDDPWWKLGVSSSWGSEAKLFSFMIFSLMPGGLTNYILELTWWSGHEQLDVWFGSVGTYAVTVGISFGVVPLLTFSYLTIVHLEPLLVCFLRVDCLRYTYKYFVRTVSEHPLVFSCVLVPKRHWMDTMHVQGTYDLGCYLTH